MKDYCDMTTAERIQAIALKHPERAAALTDRRNYRVSKRRGIVDADCDFRRWGWIWDVILTWPAGLDVSGTSTVACCGSADEAEAEINERASALTRIA